jgi:hypothetical protein
MKRKWKHILGIVESADPGRPSPKVFVCGRSSQACVADIVIGHACYAIQQAIMQPQRRIAEDGPNSISDNEIRVQV